MSNQRLRLTRLALIGLIPLFLFTHHVYPEGRIVDTTLMGLGLAFLLVSAGGRIWASLYISGRKNRELVRHGPYSLVRHPLYLFSLLGFVGVGLAFGSLLLAGILGLVFALFHAPTMTAEEEKLTGLFGDEYRAYRGEVPRFVPRALSVECPGTVRVRIPSFMKALREAALIPLVLVVAEGLEWAKLSDLLPVLIELP